MSKIWIHTLALTLPLTLALFASSAANAAVVCTVKRMSQSNHEYNEAPLSVSLRGGNSYIASVTVKDCYADVQSVDSVNFTLNVHQTSSDFDGVSSYGGLDNKGYMIASLSKSQGDYICMLVCSKK